jgi:hypothetical protein
LKQPLEKCCVYISSCFIDTHNFGGFREKKREKERDELWKKLSELELNHNNKIKESGDSKAAGK